MILTINDMSFGNLHIAYNTELTDKFSKKDFIKWYKSALKFIDIVHTNVKSYGDFLAMNWSSYAHRISMKSMKVTGYDKEDNVIWTIKWTSRTKSS